VADTVTILKHDEAYHRIACEPGVASELSEYFSFYVPGYQFMPAYRNRLWDGRIRLFQPLTGLLYAGLDAYVERFCDERGYDLNLDLDEADTAFSLVEAQEEIKEMGLPKEKSPRDYQVEAFAHCVKKRRALLLMPTASGKSLVIYMLAMHYLVSGVARCLIIVPTTTLVEQMRDDFVSYGMGESHVHRIYSGKEKDTECPVVITTWQSVYKMPREWFDQFGMVVGDEAHGFKAKSLTAIMTKLSQCRYRFGTTGTIDDSETHRLILEGLFGPVKKIRSTKELIDQKYLSPFQVKAIVLMHPEADRRAVAKMKYQDELDFIVRNEHRNKFIRNLAMSLKGNTLLLFQFVEKHGKKLHATLDGIGEKDIYYISGEVETEARNEIRKIVETKKDALIIASMGTFREGVDVPSLENIIFASPSKAKIRTLQSIGRGLRLNPGKKVCTLFDVADDLSWKKTRNYTLDHFAERIRIYAKEKFDYRLYRVQLKG